MTPPAPRRVETVGFIGLGRMGGAMAANLSAAGHDLVVHNRTRATADAFADRVGAAVAATPSELAASADLVITMLADEDALRGVLTGPEGLLGALRSGTVLIDMGTTGPAAIRGLASVVADAGGILVDAPVSGSVDAARSANLAILLGAPDDVAASIVPVLEAMGRNVHHLGDTGAGSVAKLAVNNIIYALGNAVSESLVLVEQAGIDRARIYDVFEDSAVAAPMVGYRREAFLDPEGTPPAFAVTLAQKDLRLITELAATLGVPVAQAEANLALMTRVVDDGLGDHDMADVAVHLRRQVDRGSALIGDQGSS